MVQKKKIFLIEDEPDLFEMYAKKLRSNGFEVDICVNGLEAITYLEHCTPDLILLDILLPIVDGHEILTALKHSKNNKKTPIFVISNGSEEQAKKKGLFIEAQKYFIKSNTTPREIVQSIIDFFEGREDDYNT